MKTFEVHMRHDPGKPLVVQAHWFQMIEDCYEFKKGKRSILSIPRENVLFVKMV